MANIPWSAEDLQIVIDNWGTMVAVEIGEILNPPRSKNAVIGMANRLGLAPKKSIVRGRRKAKAQRRPAPQGSVLMEDVTECRWPVTDEKPFHYCNKPREQGDYCQEHYDLGHVKNSQRI